MRTFHIGGAASGQAPRTAFRSTQSTVKLHNIKVVDRADGSLVAVSCPGICSSSTPWDVSASATASAAIKVQDEAAISAGDRGSWDPHTHPITEVAGG